ncbi:MAG: hypothetical protein FWG96_01495 [Methanomassiliicoccaceae archaeon]|nr:hypothetical protein [Methanomassiliicoccaceae archaeon]
MSAVKTASEKRVLTAIAAAVLMIILMPALSQMAEPAAGIGNADGNNISQGQETASEPTGSGSLIEWRGDASGESAAYCLTKDPGNSVPEVSDGLPPVNKEYYITATSDPLTSISPEGKAAVQKGNSITFTFSADAGSYIDAVIVDGMHLSQAEIDRGSYTFRNVGMNHTIWVKGAESEVTLTIAMVEGSGYAEYSVDYGPFTKYTTIVSLPDRADVTVRAYADDGYQFERWRVGATPLPDPELLFYRIAVPLQVMLYFAEEDEGGLMGENEGNDILGGGFLPLMIGALLLTTAGFFILRKIL